MRLERLKWLGRWLWVLGWVGACSSHEKLPAADSCQRWAARICRRAGDQSDLCSDVQASLEWFSPAACASALAAPTFLEQRMVERDRACGDLRERLCADLGAHTRACKIAREQTGKFPADRCLAMRRAYPEVRRKLAA